MCGVRCGVGVREDVVVVCGVVCGEVWCGLRGDVWCGGVG